MWPDGEHLSVLIIISVGRGSGPAELPLHNNRQSNMFLQEVVYLFLALIKYQTKSSGLNLPRSNMYLLNSL